MNIAIVGAGVSGLTAAYLLTPRHDVTVFEARDRAGGHAYTKDVEFRGDRQRIETGFIVYNERNYPLFSSLLENLGVASQPSDMSFSVHAERTGVAYRGSSLNTLFAQRANLLRPSFLAMVRDIFRFFREAPELLTETDPDFSVGHYLDRAGYSSAFVDEHILPLGAALWSTTPDGMREFPARMFARFLDNHGMLAVRGRPRWRTIRGGASRYVSAITDALGARLRLSSPVSSIRRDDDGVDIVVGDRPTPERFDHVVVAAHADEALRLIVDTDDVERETLAGIPFQPNELVLHTDTTHLPPPRRAWASWNYFVPSEPSQRSTVTYYMNRLQSLESAHHYCLTLNPTRSIEPDRIIERYRYDHPVFTADAVRSQRRRQHFTNRRRTSFVGAYWGFGFHEDGVRSATETVDALGVPV